MESPLYVNDYGSAFVERDERDVFVERDTFVERDAIVERDALCRM